MKEIVRTCHECDQECDYTVIHTGQYVEYWGSSDWYPMTQYVSTCCGEDYSEEEREITDED